MATSDGGQPQAASDPKQAILDQINDAILGVIVDDQVVGQADTLAADVPQPDDAGGKGYEAVPDQSSPQVQDDDLSLTALPANTRKAPSVLSSTSSLSSTTRKKRYGSLKGSPLAVPPPSSWRVTVDQFGFPCALTNLNDEAAWDTRHHLNGNENELKPKGMRDYFSAPQSLKEVKRELKYNPKIHNAKNVLRSLSLPEIIERKPTPVCPDAGPPLVPTRHVFGGTMRDRDGLERAWNDRWQKGISILNDHCHPDHRAYFTQNSLFEESPSQNWRRYLDQEVTPGASSVRDSTGIANPRWKSIKCKKEGNFPPLGGRLRGRSGTPCPESDPQSIARFTIANLQGPILCAEGYLLKAKNEGITIDQTLRDLLDGCQFQGQGLLQKARKVMSGESLELDFSTGQVRDCKKNFEHLLADLRKAGVV